MTAVGLCLQSKCLALSYLSLSILIQYLPDGMLRSRQGFYLFRFQRITLSLNTQQAVELD